MLKKQFLQLYPIFLLQILLDHTIQHVSKYCLQREIHILLFLYQDIFILQQYVYFLRGRRILFFSFYYKIPFLKYSLLLFKIPFHKPQYLQTSKTFWLQVSHILIYQCMQKLNLTGEIPMEQQKRYSQKLMYHSLNILLMPMHQKNSKLLSFILKYILILYLHVFLCIYSFFPLKYCLSG